MFCGWIEYAEVTPTVSVQRLWEAKELQEGPIGAAAGDGDPVGKAGLSIQSAESTSMSPGRRVLHADLLPHTCSFSGLWGQPPPCPVPPEGSHPLDPPHCIISEGGWREEGGIF